MRFLNPFTEIPAPIPSRRMRSLVGILLLLALLPRESKAIWPFDTDSAEQSEASSTSEYPEIATFLSEAIQIDTVDPPGNEEALARMITQSLAVADIETEVIETCQAKWKVKPRIKMADIMYGARQLHGASNIVFR